MHKNTQNINGKPSNPSPHQTLFPSQCVEVSYEGFREAQATA